MKHVEHEMMYSVKLGLVTSSRLFYYCVFSITADKTKWNHYKTKRIISNQYYIRWTKLKCVKKTKIEHNIGEQRGITKLQ